MGLLFVDVVAGLALYGKGTDRCDQFIAAVGDTPPGQAIAIKAESCAFVLKRV